MLHFSYIFLQDISQGRMNSFMVVKAFNELKDILSGLLNNSQLKKVNNSRGNHNYSKCIFFLI